jgi:hypothetical protein
VNKTEIERVLGNMVIKDIYRGQSLVVNDFVPVVSFVCNLCDTLYIHDRKVSSKKED